MTTSTEQLLRQADTILDEVRPYLRADGGDIAVVNFEEDNQVLTVRWLGNCAVCPLSPLTLRGGIERVLLLHLTQVKRIEVLR